MEGNIRGSSSRLTTQTASTSQRSALPALSPRYRGWFGNAFPYQFHRVQPDHPRRRRDPGKAEALEAWLADVTAGFGDQVLPVDTAVAEEWGRMSAIHPVLVIDALLAATAKANGLTLVTRNGADVAGLGVEVLNPFEAR